MCTVLSPALSPGTNILGNESCILLALGHRSRSPPRASKRRKGGKSDRLSFALQLFALSTSYKRPNGTTTKLLDAPAGAPAFLCSSTPLTVLAALRGAATTLLYRLSARPLRRSMLPAHALRAFSFQSASGYLVERMLRPPAAAGPSLDAASKRG